MKITRTRVLDIIIASILIIFILPLMFFIAIAIKLDSPGPILSRINPLGADGANRAGILRFRTTVYEPEALGRSPRLTRVGWFLRFTRIDDLPQLFNVLRGNLSLIGGQMPPGLWRS